MRLTAHQSLQVTEQFPGLFGAVSPVDEPAEVAGSEWEAVAERAWGVAERVTALSLSPGLCRPEESAGRVRHGFSFQGAAVRIFGQEWNGFLEDW
jgi:hypothetical protein